VLPRVLLRGARGAEGDAIEDVGLPDSIQDDKVLDGLPEWLFDCDDNSALRGTVSPAADRVASLNDMAAEEVGTEKQREQRIAKLFKKHGVDVVFEG
jgi:hypothetical protein